MVVVLLIFELKYPGEANVSVLGKDIGMVEFCGLIACDQFMDIGKGLLTVTTSMFSSIWIDK